MSRPKKPASPNVIVIPHRAGSLPKGMIAPILVMLVAVVGLTVRAMNPDWQGLMQEARGRVSSMLAARPAVTKKPIAKESTPKPKPKPDLAVAAKPAEPAKTKAPEMWDDIRKDAEKAKADRAEAERIKAQAEKDLANAPIPPPHRRNLRPNPADIAAILRQHHEMVRQMEAHMDRQQKLFEQMIRAQRGQQERIMREFGLPDPQWFGGDAPSRPARINRKTAQTGAIDPGLVHFGLERSPHSVAIECCEAVPFTSFRDASHGRKMGEHRIDRLIL